MKIISFGGTDPGKKRGNNEDAYLIDDSIGLYAVADGIGGSEGGEVASRIAVDALAGAIPDLLREKGGQQPSGVTGKAELENSLLRQAFAIANNDILNTGDQNPRLSGMGTTLATILIRDEVAYIAHVGDSRAYLLRSGEFKQLTPDHSFVAEQLRAGAITAEQARMSPYRHIITRALGGNGEVLPDVSQHRLQKDDRFLLCTDGLTEMVDDEDIGRILAMASPRETVQKLVAVANDRGGVDNITVVVVWVAEL
ncbi:MAG TPA: Stp1/IreP family PP2C-type Ser/Thr phosphatase [Nitrospirota bacterium]|nr:Stp1/IreP family PP2C-type Ser/Thr phosphatase [Nitrospirota bacterium]